jgi:hypothetical protein
MYKAKRTGAGHYERYQPSTPEDPSSQTTGLGTTLGDVVSSAAARS